MPISNLSLFIERQLAEWPEAAEAYRRLSDVQTRPLGVFTLQHNPSRIRSTAADTTAAAIAAAIAARPCFLCAAARPARQKALQWRGYELLLNPYPIFPTHLTIASALHESQSLDGRAADLADLARLLPELTVLFNGARCGASAPDHMHFQAVPTAALPVWQAATVDGINSFGGIGFFRYSGPDAPQLTERLARRFDGMVNVLARLAPSGEVEIITVPRKAHRPQCYATGEMLLSPASVDVGGVIVLPRESDFRSLSEAQLQQTVSETCFSAAELQPRVAVGIMTAPRIDVERHSDGTFTLRDVTIGRQFHWQRRESQRFSGELELVRLPDVGGGQLTAVNRLPVEDYLLSVISSEMSAEAPAEFLCAHAVISRSWLLAQIDRTGRAYPGRCAETPGETVRWYDHTAHRGFDVCADDHCQRYQGLNRYRSSTGTVDEALRRTAGMVLTYGGEIADARFSKCCGGVMEQFSTCWQPVDLPYLRPLRDDEAEEPVPDLTGEPEARRWILSRPGAFCATTDSPLLSRVLNAYDRETPDFYRWTVSYTARELAGIVRSRSGIDYGLIRSLRPLHRGPSARIDRLEIAGTKRTRIIGKELEIRRTLSPSHLYSSAFTVEALDPDADGVPRRWVLHGAGWGHGVGLCQIGAAVMATRGYSFRRILEHYFPGSRLTKLY